MKKYSVVLVAIILAISSAFAFRPAFNTFQFNGISTDPDDRVDPQQYSLGTGSCSGTETKLCTIEATPDINSKPVISGTLYTALWNNESDLKPDFLYDGIQGKNP